MCGYDCRETKRLIKIVWNRKKNITVDSCILKLVAEIYFKNICPTIILQAVMYAKGAFSFYKIFVYLHILSECSEKQEREAVCVVLLNFCGHRLVAENKIIYIYLYNIYILYPVKYP